MTSTPPLTAATLETLVDGLIPPFEGVHFFASFNDDEEIVGSFLIEKGSEAAARTEVDEDGLNDAMDVYEAIGDVLLEAFKGAGYELTSSGPEGRCSFSGREFVGGEYHTYARVSESPEVVRVSESPEARVYGNARVPRLAPLRAFGIYDRAGVYFIPMADAIDAECGIDYEIARRLRVRFVRAAMAKYPEVCADALLSGGLEVRISRSVNEKEVEDGWLRVEASAPNSVELCARMRTTGGSQTHVYATQEGAYF